MEDKWLQILKHPSVGAEIHCWYVPGRAWYWTGGRARLIVGRWTENEAGHGDTIGKRADIALGINRSCLTNANNVLMISFKQKQI